MNILAAPLHSLVRANRVKPPRVGSMRGQINGSPLELTVDRQNQTVSGMVNGKAVNTRVDGDGGHISGQANGAQVDLALQWSPQLVQQDGSANGSDYSATIDFERGTMAGSNMDLRFDLQQGTIAGSAFGSDVSLQSDAASGKLTGQLNDRQVSVTLTNLDVSYFLQNLYLFAPASSRR